MEWSVAEPWRMATSPGIVDRIGQTMTVPICLTMVTRPFHTMEAVAKVSLENVAPRNIKPIQTRDLIIIPFLSFFNGWIMTEPEDLATIQD
jgi:hypothetical protein